MHENLKTTISLRRENNLYEVDDRWQLIVPDYHFGTFFTLYGKFRGKCEGNKFYIEECDLYLQNYQGIITIGLVSIEDVDIAVDDILNEPVYIIKVHARALHANEKLERVPLKIKQFPIIQRHNQYVEKYQKMVQNYIDCNYRIRFEIEYDELSKTYFNREVLSNSRIIDDSKYKRDGDQLFGKNYTLYDTKLGEFVTLGSHDNEGCVIKNSIIKVQEGVICSEKCNPKYTQFMP